MVENWEMRIYQILALILAPIILIIGMTLIIATRGALAEFAEDNIESQFPVIGPLLTFLGLVMFLILCYGTYYWVSKGGPGIWDELK